MISNKQWQAWGNTGFRTIIAVSVTYLFVVVLLIATAQQKIVEGLKASEVGYDYNVAVQYYVGPDNLQGQVQRNSRLLTTARNRIRDIQFRQVGLQQQIDQAAMGLAQESTRVGNAPGCLIPPVPAGPMDPVLMRTVANAALNCTIDPTVNDPAVGIALTRLKAAATRFNAAGRGWDASNQQLTSEQEQMAALEESRVSLAGRIESAARSQGIMAMLDIFKDSGWPLVGRLVFVPPPLMAIILAFASGVFGALLITLVLSVYPDNKFQFTKSNSYIGRILLGGLIALGVVVLLFSGVAVLGGEGGTADSQNMMAYAAIGLLAGMFSDQAADWLSRTSRFSGSPASPGVPANPATPRTPRTPDTPATPGTPAIPGTAGDPAIMPPAEPEISTEPPVPTVPENPAEPAAPADPDEVERPPTG